MAEEFTGGLAFVLVIWPFERGPSFSSRLCHHHDVCWWKKSALAPMPAWKHRPEADNQARLLARVKDAAGPGPLWAEACGPQKHSRTLLKVILVLHWNAGWIFSFVTGTASAVLSLLEKAPWCVGTGSDAEWMELEEVWGIFTLLHTRLS